MRQSHEISHSCRIVIIQLRPVFPLLQSIIYMADISVGIDLATSASIIGASIAYFISERKRRRAEREWKRQLISQKQVELSHSIVGDVLAFLPVITATARKVHDAVQFLPRSSPDGAAPPDLRSVCIAIREEVDLLRERVEFELLRPLEVKVDFVAGVDVWKREASACRAKLDVVKRAIEGLAKECCDPSISGELTQRLFSQAVPLVAAAEPIGQTDSFYSAIIGLAKSVKFGLLAMQQVAPASGVR